MRPRAGQSVTGGLGGRFAAGRLTAHAAVVARRNGHGGTRIAGLRSQAPLLLRETPGAIYLVGGAAAPLGGDDLRLTIDAGPGADIEVRSVAAAIALPGDDGCGSTFHVEAHVAAGATLRWLPEPTIAAAGCDHRATVRVTLESDARLLWRDELILGRDGESAGDYRGRFDLTLDGEPIVRHELIVGPGAPAYRGGAVVGDARAVGSLYVCVPEWSDGPPGPVVLGRRAALLPLCGPAAQIVATAYDAPELRALLDSGARAACASP